MDSRSKRVFQLITLLLVVSVFNVYIMGAPIPSKGATPKGNDAKAETTAPDSSATTGSVTAKAAAEKLPLTPGSKINFNRIFSKTEIQKGTASSHTFLNAKVSGGDIFKAPPRAGSSAVPGGDDNDNDESAEKGTWIAVGIIAAVLTIAVIGLRHDRHQ